MADTSSGAGNPKIDAFKKIHADLSKIIKHKKCRSCVCFYKDVLNIVHGKIRSFRATESDDALAVIEDDLKRWIEDAVFLQMHG